MPAETINFEACSKVTSKYIKSFFGNINKKPLVGFGVVGTKTLTNSSLTFFSIIPLFSPIFLETSVHKFCRLHLESLKHLSKDLSCPKIQTFKAYEITKRDLKVDKKKFDIFIKEYISNSLDSCKTNFLLRDYRMKY